MMMFRSSRLKAVWIFVYSGPNINRSRCSDLRLRLPLI
jgi:hypothetical protein